MKKALLLLVFIFTLSIFNIRAQENYVTSSGEFIFSLADVRNTAISEQQNTNLRFTAFFHWNVNWHIDFNNNVGIYTGGAIRNVGLIRKVNDSLKIKERVYTFGIPLAFKLGDFDKNLYFFAGGEVEFPFNFKQKTFIDNKKEDKENWWLSDRTDWYMPSVFAGITFPGGLSVKAKYYINNFYNQDFKTNGNMPYQNLEANIFYISLSTMLKFSDVSFENDNGNSNQMQNKQAGYWKD